MKFTKDEFSEELKKRLSNNGKKKLSISPQTYDGRTSRAYARLEKWDDERELDEVVNEYLEEFEELEGNYRRDYATFVKTKTKELEEEFGKKNPKNTDDPTGNGGQGGQGGNAGGDDAMSKILAKLEALEKKQNERDKAEKIAAKRKELKSALKKDGVEDAEWIDSYIRKLNITEETDIDEEKDDALKLYNKSNSQTPPNQTPGGAGGKGGNDVDLSDLRPKAKE